jgi:intein/homing endonuclease
VATAREVSEQIIAAWDEMQEGTPTETPDVQPTEETTEEPTENDESEEEVAVGDEVTSPVETPEEEEEEAEEDEEGDESEEEEPEEGESGYASEDPEVQALLAKFQGDVEKALKYGAQSQHTFARLGQEKQALLQQITDLQQQLATSARSYSTAVSPDQRQWIETALESEAPGDYVQEAVRAGEFNLARVLCDQMAETEPYSASRLAQWVDQSEAYMEQAYQQQAANEAANTPLDHPTLMSILVEHFPQMPAYEDRMVATLETLGPNHPLAQDARSNDPQTAARGIVGIFEIARASSAVVSETRQNVKRQQRAAADEARNGAVVSSAQATPTGGQTPAPRRLGPGLTLEQLNDAWETQ